MSKIKRAQASRINLENAITSTHTNSESAVSELEGRNPSSNTRNNSKRGRGVGNLI